MNNCKICLQPKLRYAFRDKQNCRYLVCDNCQAVHRDQVDSNSSHFVYDVNTGERYHTLSELLNYLSRVERGASINLQLTSGDFQHVTSEETANFILSKKAIFVLLNRYKFTDVVLSLSDNDLTIAATKKVRGRFKISFIVPVYNEVTTCLDSIRKIENLSLAGLDKEIIIVESNSTDGTREILQSAKFKSSVKLIFQDQPRGKGNAVRLGLDCCTGDFISIHDADDEYDIEDLLNLLPPLTTGQTNFVLGNRHSSSWWKMRTFTNQPFRAFILNCGQILFTFLLNKSVNARLKDPFTMYKLFRRDALTGIQFFSDRFDFDHELVIKLIKSGNYPIEIPVNYRSRSFEEGKKVRFFADPITWLRAIYKYGFKNK